ncbi:mevalonate kinase [Winogradskyella sp. PG-2]|uniref:mevalonate kinase family protein n=1 Tax=Winogradskyella sp. PG-2 TaxID=754409 RepID=UPI0004586764|nr:galactokinase family protein [Winogradskyella sp. PG-2]BAO76863.1 mevalonate kinase [Winogradskyella sp. PG-2]
MTLFLNNQIISTAPARICLFGDHQDYLQLPIIACAIDRYIRIKAKPNDNRTLHIFKHDLNQEDVIQLNEPVKIIKEDYLRLSLIVLARYNCIPNQGYDVHISGNIPINSGLSSSSALTVAWVQFLIEAFGINEAVSPMFVARLAYEIEVIEQNTSGGKMDQYSISLGHKIFMNTKTDAIHNFTNILEGMVVGDSGEGKDTLGTLSHLKGDAWKAINQVKAKYLDFDITTMNIADLEKFMPIVNEALQPIFEAAVLNYSITKNAEKALLETYIDYSLIGDLMNQHHALLRDNLLITTPKIDAMINAALKAGAYGAKIVGSGKGGCIVALSPKAKEEAIIYAIKNAGAKDAFLVKESEGAHILSQIK